MENGKKVRTTIIGSNRPKHILISVVQVSVLTSVLIKYKIISKKVNEKRGFVGATEMIMNMAKNNNGTVTAAMVAAAGFSRGNLKYLVDKGKLEKSSRGIYILPEVWEDEFLNLQSRFGRGVFSHETALFLWDLTDRTPNYYSMTFPSAYNLTKPKENHVKCMQSAKALYDLGISVLGTPSGNKVKVYNMERTLCDILRSHSHVDIQIVTDAFKRYATRRDKNIPLLSEYAKTFKVEKRLRAYLEVLL